MEQFSFFASTKKLYSKLLSHIKKKTNLEKASPRFPPYNFSTYHISAHMKLPKGKVHGKSNENIRSFVTRLCARGNILITGVILITANIRSICQGNSIRGIPEIRQQVSLIIYYAELSNFRIPREMASRKIQTRLFPFEAVH